MDIGPLKDIISENCEMIRYYASRNPTKGPHLLAMANLYGLRLTVMEEYYLKLPRGSILPKKYKDLEEGVRGRILNKLNLRSNLCTHLDNMYKY